MKIHSALLAPLVIIAFFGVILIGKGWELPSMQKEFAVSSGGSAKTEMIVQGLRCRGTSNFFVKLAGQIPGVTSVSTYVQEHRAVIHYDPKTTDPKTIAQRIEKPVSLESGKVVAPFKVQKITD